MGVAENKAVEDMIGAGETVSSRWTMRGTNSGSFLGAPPTGQVIAIAGIDMIRFRDGKMAEHWAQMDMLGMMTQLGLAPAPDAAPA